MKRGSNTFKISMGGIFLALTIIFLYGAAFIPGIEMTLFALSSCFVAFMLLETGVGGAVCLFTAASLLGFFMLPNKLAMLPYICFFGYYGIAKYYIEKLHSSIAQIIIKLVLFALVLSVAFFGFMELVAGAIHLPDYPLAVLLVCGMIMLFLYDFIYTYAIRFYVRRVQHKGLDNFKLS